MADLLVFQPVPSTSGTVAGAGQAAEANRNEQRPGDVTGNFAGRNGRRGYARRNGCAAARDRDEHPGLTDPRWPADAVTTMAPRFRGTVVVFNAQKRFAFARRDYDGEVFYVGASAPELAGLNVVAIDDVISFGVIKGPPGGKPRAVRIRMIAPASEGSP